MAQRLDYTRALSRQKQMPPNPYDVARTEQPNSHPMKPLAEFTDYQSLQRALCEVREHRNISYEVLNHIAGAPDRYFEKIFVPNPSKGIGLRSLGWALGGLCVRCVVVDDPEALKRYGKLFVPRDRAHLASAMGRWSKQA